MSIILNFIYTAQQKLRATRVFRVGSRKLKLKINGTVLFSNSNTIPLLRSMLGQFDTDSRDFVFVGCASGPSVRPFSREKALRFSTRPAAGADVIHTKIVFLVHHTSFLNTTHSALVTQRVFKPAVLSLLYPCQQDSA